MKPSIWTQSNQGDTVTLYSCAICGASVQTQDRAKHEDWHWVLGETKCVRAPKGKR